MPASTRVAVRRSSGGQLARNRPGWKHAVTALQHHHSPRVVRLRPSLPSLPGIWLLLGSLSNLQKVLLRPLALFHREVGRPRATTDSSVAGCYSSRWRPRFLLPVLLYVGRSFFLWPARHKTAKKLLLRLRPGQWPHQKESHPVKVLLLRHIIVLLRRGGGGSCCAARAAAALSLAYCCSLLTACRARSASHDCISWVSRRVLAAMSHRWALLARKRPSPGLVGRRRLGLAGLRCCPFVQCRVHPRVTRNCRPLLGLDAASHKGICGQLCLEVVEEPVPGP